MSSAPYRLETRTSDHDICEMFCHSDEMLELWEWLVQKVEKMVPPWSRSQKDDIVWDLVQEVLHRISVYRSNTEQNDIVSLKWRAIIIAKNLLRDQMRKRSRILHSESSVDFCEENDSTEKVSEIVKEVASFRKKTCLPVLTSIAISERRKATSMAGCHYYIDVFWVEALAHDDKKCRYSPAYCWHSHKLTA